MKNVSDVVACVVDSGLFCEQAVTLAKTYKRVLYCVPGAIQCAFPRLNNTKIGIGLEGIEVVESIFGDFFDEVDLWIFPDVYLATTQLFLERLGKVVWGARMAEELELSRDGCKRLMKAEGLPVGSWEMIKGTADLREFLKVHPKRWVKVNKYRGMFETFFSKDYRDVETRIDEIEYSLGAFKTELEFIVEEDLPDRVELGTDGYVVDGEYPTKLLSGIEIKDLAYLGIFKSYADLPEPLTRWNTAMAKHFKEYHARTFFSAECRIGKDHIPFMCDACIRSGSPPNELFQIFYENFSEIIWSGANGKLIDPIPVAKWGAEVLIHSPFADKNFQPVEFPQEFREFVKLRNAVKINGRFYAVPQAVGLPEIGAVCGFGNSMDEAFEMCKEVASHVTGYYIDIDVKQLDNAQQEVERMEEFNLKMF